MTRGFRNWHAALISWAIGTLVVGAAYFAWARWRGQRPAWDSLLRAALLALLYAAFLAWRFRERDERP